MLKKMKVIVICIWLLAGCNSTAQPDAGILPDADQCINPEHAFAYQTSGKLASDANLPLVLPPTPWTLEAKLPDFPEESILNTRKDWVLAAFPQPDGQQDLWVLRSWTDDRSKSEFASLEILVYATRTKAWFTVSAQVKGTRAVVGELFRTGDGTVWAHNYGGDFFTVFEPPLQVGISRQTESPASVPLLSKYNEKENQFEPVNIAGNLSSAQLDGEWEKVLLDQNGIFWIFIQGDGIYSYTPESQAVKRHADLGSGIYKLPVRSVALDAVGNLYFSDDSSAVLRFAQATQTIEKIGGIPLPLDHKYSLYFHGILPDASGRLWVGNLGWAEPPEYHTWYQLFPAPIFVARSEGDTLYAQQSPWLILESADGRLWYKFANGLAWLNPQKEKWCWFTSSQSNLVKDQQGNLWMSAGGNLYEYQPIPAAR